MFDYTMFDYTNTVLIRVDYNKGEYIVIAEQFDGTQSVVANELSWASVKSHLADAREQGLNAKASSRAMLAVRKEMMQ